MFALLAMAGDLGGSIGPGTVGMISQKTGDNIQAGLFYGSIGEAEYIVKKMKEESGLPNIKVIATGGLGGIIAEECEAIDIYDSLLTLKGLRIIHRRCTGK